MCGLLVVVGVPAGMIRVWCLCEEMKEGVVVMNLRFFVLHLASLGQSQMFLSLFQCKPPAQYCLRSSPKMQR